MNISSASSEWSSGCDSGWTFYLNESISQSPNQHQKSSRKSFHDHHHHQNYTPNIDDDEDGEEDLSMVSDASSGPPHIHYEEQCKEINNGFGFRYSSSKKNKAKENSFLDDTASSSALNYPNGCINQSNNQHAFGFSQGNGLMGKSAFGDQIGISTHGRQQEQAEASKQVASKEAKVKTMDDADYYPLVLRRRR
ncbi:hypothetical protein V2J09_007098 [Rumex salicifolius]